MITTKCPGCGTELAVTGLDLSRKTAEHRFFDDNGASAVRSLIEPLSGQFTFADLRAMYDERRPERDWPELSDKALGRALHAAGAQPWRNRRQRGWRV